MPCEEMSPRHPDVPVPAHLSVFEARKTERKRIVE